MQKSKDLDTICHKELVGSLKTYESTLPRQKNGKTIALKSIKKEDDYSSDDDPNSKDIALIARKFRKFMLKKKTTVKIKKKGKDFAKRNK